MFRISLVVAFTLAACSTGPSVDGGSPSVGGGAGGGSAFPGTGGGGAGGGDGGGGAAGTGGGVSTPSCVEATDPGPTVSAADDGGTPVDTRVLVEPARPPPPLSGGTLAVLPNGTVVAADPDRDRVWLLETTETTARSVALTLGDEPGRVVAGPNGRAFVALRARSEVAEIDPAAGTLVARHAACAAPRGMLWLDAKKTLVVACATGTLARLTFAVTGTGLTLTNTVLQHPGDDLRDVVLLGDGGMLVSQFRTARALRVADDGSAEVVGRGSFNNSENRFVAWRMVPSGANALILNQWTLDPKPADGGFVGPDGCGAPLYGGPLSQPVLSTINGLTDVQTEWAPNAPLAIDAAVNGIHTALVSAGRNIVTIDQMDRVVGGEPTSIAFVSNIELVVFSREPARLVFLPLVGPGSRVIELGGGSVKSTSHALFHRSTKLGLACAACHPEAGDDSHIWPLPEGPRRTNTLRGGLKASAPFHWQGDRADMRALLADVYVHRMGGQLPHPAAVTGLMNWLDAQPKLPADPLLDAAAVARGKALFESPAQGCLTCHAGALGTNNSNADVGTGGVFQVPRLVELAAHGPYFHDGSLATLEARFATPTTVHGNTTGLSAADIADLVTYLKSR